jgi:hypothetical protein
METKTFKTIFSLREEAGKRIGIERIEIPKIQRDFAYGRTDAINTRKRENFLKSLLYAVSGNPITLDFVYGDIKDNKFTPLDGQQRLTTLFLLYWFASKLDGVIDNECAFLRKFSYETRTSARKFCEAITTKPFEIDSRMLLSEQIKDKNWFPLEWQHDATISSMLVMLDAIQSKFSKVDHLLTKLENISFYFLEIEDMGLTDELYIKMNSRGKPLTQFEHFKAEFEKQLKQADADLAKRLGSKIDKEWTDLLWQYHNSGLGNDNDDTTDDEFLRYFIFICNIICYNNGGSPKTSDEFELIREYFTVNVDDDEQIDRSRKKVVENAITLEKFFDCWLDENKRSIPIQNFFEMFASKEHAIGKIKTNYNVNLFEDCLRNYADIIGKKRRKFTLNQIILLYAFVLYRQNMSYVSEDDFRRRLRILNNLILNSPDQISDSEERQGGNRLPAILRQTDSIILHGIIADSETIGINFNPTQLEEEKTKLEWTKANPGKVEHLFALEDHELLYGQISIVGLEHYEHFEKFKALFECNWDLVDCALLITGDYKQRERNGWRYQLGSSMNDGFAWKMLFHRSDGFQGFEKTKTVLNNLLKQIPTVTDDTLKQIIDHYLNQCEKNNTYPWTYYYTKYKVFRADRYGKYWWDNFEESPYVFTTLHTAKNPSPNSYNPFLKALSDNVWREWYGNYIELGNDRLLKESQSSYQIVTNDEEEKVLDEILILQGLDGIDKENRIEKMKGIFESLK